VRLVLQLAYGGWYADHWQLRDPDLWFKRGLDEAPLAWAVTEVLNTLLPAPFIDFIINPIDTRELTPTPTVMLAPTATSTPVRTVDSPLLAPTP
jgi:hypothetical protein